MRWKNLSTIPRELLILTIVLLAFAIYANGGAACNLNASGCGSALLLPGVIYFIDNLGPLLFLPCIIAAILFLVSLNWKKI